MLLIDNKSSSNTYPRHSTVGEVVARMVHKRPLLERLVFFACVGSFCLLLQIISLKLLKAQGLTPAEADAVAFLFSAQINFWLSYKLTWNDTVRVRGQTFVREWLTFQGVILLGGAVNVLVYTALHSSIGDVGGVLFAVAASISVTFVLNHRVTFRFHGQSFVALEQSSGIDSLAWFMPAHNEAENLRHFVPEIVEYLQDLGCRFSVIVVNDGSTDATVKVCQKLASIYPQVQLETHETNLGYGAAVRTGFKSALRTGHSLIGFCDSDRQFRIENLEPMLLEIEAAHAVLGYRLKRADNLKRRIMGWGWHHMSMFILGFKVRDTDCGFKLFRRELVEVLAPKLRGDKAVVSPELIAWIQKMGFLVAETGVEHHPRLEGEQSGDSLMVIFGSIIGLFRTYYYVHLAPSEA